MGDLIFIVKTFIITSLVLIFLQIKLGTTTLEEKTYTWLQTSSVSQPIRDVAKGAGTVVRKLMGKVSIDTTKEHAPLSEGEQPEWKRQSKFQWERSKKYLNEKAKKAASRLADHLERDSHE